MTQPLVRNLSSACLAGSVSYREQRVELLVAAELGHLQEQCTSYTGLACACVSVRVSHLDCRLLHRRLLHRRLLHRRLLRDHLLHRHLLHRHLLHRYLLHRYLRSHLRRLLHDSEMRAIERWWLDLQRVSAVCGKARVQASDQALTHRCCSTSWATHACA
jgi:hypothetical protein